MLQRQTPDDYVVATGVTTTVRRFCELAFRAAGIDVVFEGGGIDESGIVASDGPLKGKTVVMVDPLNFRPAEVDLFIGNPAKAKRELGWDPSEFNIEDLARDMVDHDLIYSRSMRE